MVNRARVIANMGKFDADQIIDRICNKCKHNHKISQILFYKCKLTVDGDIVKYSTEIVN